MHSAIIIAPVSLIPVADAFAAQVGLPEGQFTQPYGEGHMLCHFPPSETALAALVGDLPEWLQVIVTDDETPAAPEPAKVCVFLSAAQDGWQHKATVDRLWPDAAP